MKYESITEGKFVKRLNRFVAEVEIQGGRILCHVKNTGRCRELLKEGATVYLEKSSNVQRKYQYSLITVRKGERLVNMDSQAPNKAVYEFIKNGGLFEKISLIKPECTYKKSRFDFYVEYNGKKAFVEVKGVTLENEGVVSFPDAPTQRGARHLNELCQCIEEGYEAHVFFAVQMKDVRYFTPSGENDPAFREALINAADKGVKIHAYDCTVTENEMKISEKVTVIL